VASKQLNIFAQIDKATTRILFYQTNNSNAVPIPGNNTTRTVFSGVVSMDPTVDLTTANCYNFTLNTATSVIAAVPPPSDPSQLASLLLTHAKSAAYVMLIRKVTSQRSKGTPSILGQADTYLRK